MYTYKYISKIYIESYTSEPTQVLTVRPSQQEPFINGSQK